MTEYEELSNWIKENIDRFINEHYTVDDIAILAIRCGFSRAIVAQWEAQKPICGAL